VCAAIGLPSTPSYAHNTARMVARSPLHSTRATTNAQGKATIKFAKAAEYNSKVTKDKAIRSNAVAITVAVRTPRTVF